MSLENQGGYHEVHVYERRRDSRPWHTRLARSFIVHGDRAEIGNHFWDRLPDNQTPYVHETIGLSAVSMGFKERASKITPADGDVTKTSVDIFFLRNGKLKKVA